MTRAELVQATLLALTRQNVARDGGGGSFTATGSLSTQNVIWLGPVPLIPKGIAEAMTADAALVPIGDVIETDIGPIPSGLSEQFMVTTGWGSYLIGVGASGVEQMTAAIGVATEVEVINNG